MSKEITQQQLSSLKQPYAILFYSPNCGHCIKMKPEWEKFANNSSFISVYKYDCSKKQSPPFVDGYPTIIFAGKGKKVKYNGERSAGKFIEKAMELSS